MHNTTHYRTLTLFAIMLMMSSGAETCTKDEKTSPKKKTEQEGISSTNEADTDNKNNGKTPPGNGKTLDHYKQIVEDKFPDMRSLCARNDSERKQKILAFATILAVLDDNEKAVDEGLEATSAAMLLNVLALVCYDFDPVNATFVKLGIIAAVSKAKPKEEEKKRIRAEIRKKSKKVLDNLLEKTDDGTTLIQYLEDKTRKKNHRTMVTKLLRKKLKERFRGYEGALLHWCIENGFSNAEDKKAFVDDLCTKSRCIIRTAVGQGDLETMRLLVKAGLDLRKTGDNLLLCARDSGHTEMEQFLKDNDAT